MQAELESKRREQERVSSELDNNREALSKLIATAGVHSPEDFRKKYRDQEKVSDWMQQKESAMHTIETVAGQGKSEDVIHYLGSHEKDEIESRLLELKDQVRRKEEALSMDEKDLGGKQREQERLEGASELAGSLTRLEVEKEKLREAYMHWLTNKAALAVLDRVKKSVEQEKQPELIKSSAGYFRKITGERYPKIRVSMEEDERILAYDAREAARTLEQLSRGTREQLLTSIRLGFIGEYEKHAEALPVIVDEVLVNYDPVRARETAALLEEFAKERQLLFFTCHPSTKELFSKDIVVHSLQDS
jgi:uncharacterized protein YhaN